MKVTRLDLPVMASLMEENGRRLDCNPYLSGGFEARVLLKKLDVEKQPLQDLVCGHNGGIYNGPHFIRNYVNDPAVGVPFVTSGSMMLADLSMLNLLRKKDAESPKLSYLKLEEGMTLISSSGTIGRLTYTRPDMAGMWSSQDAMKVVPDRAKILPGYLYAYLSSRFGVALIVSGTYGSIIQHLEPSHIADLPVPRLGDALEQKIHDLITEAAELRTKASQRLASTILSLEQLAGLPVIQPACQSSPDVSSTSSNLLVSRLDAMFHSNYHKAVVESILTLPESERTTVGEMATKIFEPTRFKRIPMDDSIHGVPFFGTSVLMWLEPKHTYFIPRKPDIDQYIVDEKTLLVPRSGQINGIIGRVVFPYGQIIGGAITEDAIRITTDSPVLAGYIFIALSSEYGLRQLKARAFGSSIPHLDVSMIGDVQIPKLAKYYIEDIGNQGWQISKDRSLAIQKEQKARSLLEEFIASSK
jgi:type I restriction enzyme, S subunit